MKREKKKVVNYYIKLLLELNIKIELFYDKMIISYVHQ